MQDSETDIYLLSVNYLQVPHPEVIMDQVHINILKHIGGKAI